MSDLAELEPAWTTLHNAHLQSRTITISREDVTVTGEVVGFERLYGVERVTVRSGGGRELTFIVAGSEVVFA
jgi:hypothetical protein